MTHEENKDRLIELIEEKVAVQDEIIATYEKIIQKYEKILENDEKKEQTYIAIINIMKRKEELLMRK